jgi:hypothetical protein
MFNDRFNDRVRRCRLAALLVLAVLVLFGLGAGHLATRALGAQGATSFARADFRDGSNDRLLSDDGRDYVHGENCVENTVLTRGLWRLTTHTEACSQPPRFFKLELVPVDYTGDGSEEPNSVYGTNALEIGQSDDVYLQIKAHPFSREADTTGKSETNVYIRTEAGGTPGGTGTMFRLRYKQALTVRREGPANERTLTTDPPSGSPADPTLADADLYRYNPTRPYETWRGTFRVPFSTKITTF